MTSGASGRVAVLIAERISFYPTCPQPRRPGSESAAQGAGGIKTGWTKPRSLRCYGFSTVGRGPSRILPPTQDGGKQEEWPFFRFRQGGSKTLGAIVGPPELTAAAWAHSRPARCRKNESGRQESQDTAGTRFHDVSSTSAVQDVSHGQSAINAMPFRRLFPGLVPPPPPIGLDRKALSLGSQQKTSGHWLLAGIRRISPVMPATSEPRLSPSAAPRHSTPPWLP